MADIGRLLETMHPMREPPAPEAIAPYLLLLALGCGAGALLLFVVWRLRHRRVAFQTSVAALLDASRTMAPADRLAAQANLLRRIVRSIAGDEAAHAQGDAWLQRLDRVFETHFFTQGEGVAFGEKLYRRSFDVDIEALDRTLLALVSKVRV